MEARRIAVAVLVGTVVLAGCGSGDDSKDAAVRPSASATASATATSPAETGTTPVPSATSTTGSTTTTPTAKDSTATRGALTGKVTQAGDTTARLSTAGGAVAIRWSSGTVIVDTVAAQRSEVAIGSCVLVLPPSDGPSPTAKAMTAAVVRVVESSPSCPPIPGASPTLGMASPGPAGTGGSVTVTGGTGVIGTVSAVSGKSFTLLSRGDARTRTIAVSTTAATQYRKAGDHPRAAIEVGRCATVWGTEHDGARLIATRIRMSDPVDGACPSPLS